MDILRYVEICHCKTVIESCMQSCVHELECMQTTFVTMLRQATEETPCV